MKRVGRLLRKNQRGFTLIELVVVIAILGILSSVALPRVGGITQRAKEVADQANVRILQEAVERYMAESGDEDLSSIGTLNGTDKENADDVIEALIDGVGSYGPYLKESFDTIPQQDDKNYTFDDNSLEFDVK